MSFLLQLRNISFAYPGRPLVLQELSLTLGKGDRLGLVGDNGAGKSTLLHILVGLLRPTGGEVEIFGRIRKTEADFREVRQRVGLVFQDPDDQLFCPTVVDDVAFGPLNLGQSHEQAVATVEAILETLDLKHLRDRITHKLSGGEKRLVSLAAVLAMTPDMLLFDEPTNALDANTRGRLVEIMNGLPQAMVVVSHDAHFRNKVTTSAMVLEKGCLKPKGPPRCAHAGQPSAQ